jgi:2-dehydro-3-deoxy-D-arabinonate dehydratase
MILYKLKSGILAEHQGRFFHLRDEGWDQFVNDDDLLRKSQSRIDLAAPISDGSTLLEREGEAPIESQELWAAGVTYLRSKVGRQEESKDAGGGDFYARVYDAERPELFFKGTRQRIVGTGNQVRIRRDSHWNVPEPELTLLVTSRGKIVGYTIGNDMSSRSIEGENPLYLPQAKTYDGSAALGPGVYVSTEPLPGSTVIAMEILRGSAAVFAGAVELHQMKRSPEELVSFLFRECSFPHGCMLMTGTGLVPTNEFSLRSGDIIRITIEPIGTLVNTVT